MSLIFLVAAIGLTFGALKLLRWRQTYLTVGVPSWLYDYVATRFDWELNLLYFSGRFRCNSLPYVISIPSSIFSSDERFDSWFHYYWDL